MDPFGGGQEFRVSGAEVNAIIAYNFLRVVASRASTHSSSTVSRGIRKYLY